MADSFAEGRTVGKMLALGIGRRRGGRAAQTDSVVVARVGDKATVDGVCFGWWDEGTSEQVDWEWQYCVMQKGPQVAGRRSARTD